MAQPTPVEDLVWEDLEAGGYTDLGAALRELTTQLRVPPMEERALPPAVVLISDGMPTDEATLAANGYDYLDAHLRQVIDDVEARSPVQLAAIGIGHDVSRFYRNATRIARIDDLGPALTTKLMALLTT